MKSAKRLILDKTISITDDEGYTALFCEDGTPIGTVSPIFDRPVQLQTPEKETQPK